MIRAEIPYTAMLPIEDRGVNLAIVERYQLELEHGREFLSVPLVPLYPDVFDRDLILVDGHNRTYAHYLAGKLMVPSLIHSEDSDIEASTAYALARMSGLEAVRAHYRERWQVNMIGRGVTGIASIPQYRFPPLSSWRPALVPLGRTDIVKTHQ